MTEPTAEASSAPAQNLDPQAWLGDFVVLLPIAAALVALHLALAGSYGVFRDELYYLACGRRLAWGYVDHPPVVAFMGWLAQAFGASMVAIRIQLSPSRVRRRHHNSINRRSAGRSARIPAGTSG